VTEGSCLLAAFKKKCGTTIRRPNLVESSLLSGERGSTDGLPYHTHTSVAINGISIALREPSDRRWCTRSFIHHCDNNSQQQDIGFIVAVVSDLAVHKNALSNKV